MTHAEFAESLRIAADWWEAHPEIELPFQNNPFKYVAIRREQMEKIAVALGSCKKKYADGFFNLTAKMGHAEFVAFCHREQVCERIVTGTKHIEERVIPAHTEESGPPPSRSRLTLRSRRRSGTISRVRL